METPEEVTNHLDSSQSSAKRKRTKKQSGDGTKVNKGRVDPSRKSGLTPNAAGNYRGKKRVDELLTDEQKKQHHIASEQKRRRNIKIGYDRLTALVPDLQAEADSEQGAIPPSETTVLQKSVEYLQSILKTRALLEAEVQALREESATVPSDKVCFDHPNAT